MARPREFDEAVAAERALEVFWASGFQNTSLDALEEATGLNRSSLYNTFGGKGALFVRVLDDYSAGPCEHMFAALNIERGAAALAKFLDQLVAFVESEIGERGCLMVKTSSDPSLIRTNTKVANRVEAHFAHQGKLLKKRFSEALVAGTINSRLRPLEGAQVIATFARGVLAGAAGGMSSSALRSAVRAMKKQLGI